MFIHIDLDKRLNLFFIGILNFVLHNFSFYINFYATNNNYMGTKKFTITQNTCTLKCFSSVKPHFLEKIKKKPLP